MKKFAQTLFKVDLVISKHYRAPITAMATSLLSLVQQCNNYTTTTDYKFLVDSHHVGYILPHNIPHLQAEPCFIINTASMTVELDPQYGTRGTRSQVMSQLLTRLRQSRVFPALDSKCKS